MLQGEGCRYERPPQPPQQIPTASRSWTLGAVTNDIAAAMLARAPATPPGMGQHRLDHRPLHIGHVEG
jgi:hypothetical protein